MRSRILLILGCLFLSSISNVQAQVTGDSASFDGREWFVGYTAGNEHQRISEFYLKNESVDKWTELITIEEYADPAMPVNLEEHVTTRVKSVAKFCPKVKSEIIEKSGSNIIYGWSVKDCGQYPGQYKIARAIVTPERMFVIRYSSNSPIRSAGHKKWVKILKDAKFRMTALSEAAGQQNPEAEAAK